MWINGINSDQLSDMYIANGGGGTFNLVGDTLVAYAYAGPYPSITIGSYASIALLVAAVEEFVAAAGEPWLIVGDLSTISSGQTVACNFKNLLKFIDNPGIGIYFGTTSTNGYAPWANYADARAGILELIGNLAV